MSQASRSTRWPASAAARWRRPSGGSSRLKNTLKRRWAMSDHARKIERAVACVDLEWGAAEAADAEERFRRRLKRRKLVRRVALVPALAAAAAVVLLMVGSRDGAVRFADGSVATPVDSGSQLRVVSSAETRTVVNVERGGGRFRVAKNPKRV